VVATFPIRAGDDVMLVTDGGRLIRTPGDGIRLTGRQAMGVMLLRLDESERVASVFPVIEQELEGNGAEDSADDGGDEGK
jgi:DNA gyrase subunit A